MSSERHGLSFVRGIVLSPHYGLSVDHTQHLNERLLLALCIASIRKQAQDFNLLRFTLAPGLSLGRAPDPIPFCLFRFLFEDCPLANRFTWIFCFVEPSDVPPAASLTSLKCSTFRIGLSSNWKISDPF